MGWGTQGVVAGTKLRRTLNACAGMVRVVL